MKKLFLFLLPFLLTGCVSYQELGNIEIVENFGIDYQENTFYLTLTTVEKKEDKIERKTKEAKGESIQDALENIKVQEHKKLYFAHLDLLLLTPKVIEEKQKDVLNFFLENTESRNDFQMALTPSLDFLKENTEIELKELLTITQTDLGTTKTIHFEEYLKNILEENLNYLPILKKEETLTASSISFIQKNKIIETLTEEETILYNLLTSTLQNANIQNTQCNDFLVNTTFKNSKINLTIDLTTRNSSPNFQQELTESLYQLIEKYQQKGIDLLNIQKIIATTSPKYYEKQKNTLFQKERIKIQVKERTNQKTERNFMDDEKE